MQLQAHILALFQKTFLVETVLDESAVRVVCPSWHTCADCGHRLRSVGGQDGGRRRAAGVSWSSSTRSSLQYECCAFFDVSSRSAGGLSGQSIMSSKYAKLDQDYQRLVGEVSGRPFGSVPAAVPGGGCKQSAFTALPDCRVRL